MSRLTLCPRSTRRRPVLPMGRNLALGIAFLACLSLGLSQLYLRFEISNLVLQTAGMQSHRLDLESKVNHLRGEVEARKRGDRLIAHAMDELGMVPYTPEDSERVRIDADVRKLFDRAMADRTIERRRAIAAEAESSWSELLIARIGIAGRAFAGDKDR